MASWENIDFSPIANLPKTYKNAQAERTLADLGKGLADGTLDYRQAAGMAAQAGKLDVALGLIKMGGEEEANKSFQSLFGPQAAAPTAAPAQRPPMTLASLANPTQPQAPMPPDPAIAAPPRAAVEPTAKVWGDKEAEDAGLYEKPGFTQRFAGAEPLSPLDNFTGAAPRAQTAMAHAPALPPAPQPVPQPTQQPAQQDGLDLTPKMRQLIGAASHPRLPAAQKEIAKTLLTRELDNSKLPDPVKKYLFAKGQGFTGTFLEFETQLRRAGATAVNVDQRGENEYSKQTAKDFAELNRKMIEGAQKDRMKLATLDRMGALLKSPDIYTGAGGEQVLNVKRMAKAIGVDVGDVSGGEAVRAIGNQFALELRNPSGGAGMPGALSDKDLAFLKASVPGLQQSPEGNALIIDYMKRMAQRSLDVERMRQQYVRTNRHLDEGFYRELESYSAANPLFPEADKAPTPSGPAAPQAPAQPQALEGRTATNPKTGAKLMFRGGQWVPASGL